jgi:hypothetical protein
MGIKTRYREKPEQIPASEKLTNDEPSTDAVESPIPAVTDEASERLRKQLADLQRAEGFQRLISVAANQAAQEGHTPNTDAHNYRTRQLIDQHLARAVEQPAPIRQPAPLPALPPEPERAAIYSAPVSREVTGNGYRPSPSSMRLSIEQREAARLAGISEVEYARQLQKLGPWKAMRGVETE